MRWMRSRRDAWQTLCWVLHRGPIVLTRRDRLGLECGGEPRWRKNGTSKNIYRSVAFNNLTMHRLFVHFIFWLFPTEFVSATIRLIYAHVHAPQERPATENTGPLKS